MCARPVLIAKQMPGVPVKMIWSREEDMTHGNYHPTTMCKLTGGLDKDGNLVGLHVRISGQSILATLLPQNLQNGMDPAAFQGFAPGGRRRPTATTCRTCWSITRCATRTSRRASGAA
jgi:isoquinoline 1-oxidoreductase beta subunit